MIDDATVPELAAAITACVQMHRFGVSALSDRYDLNADGPDKVFPEAKATGCYFIFDADDRLLYIGKASLKSTIGRRLSTYFRWKADRLEVRHSAWSPDKEPTFVRAVSVAEPYQAASLEEYLIDRLQPSQNTRK